MKKLLVLLSAVVLTIAMQTGAAAVAPPYEVVDLALILEPGGPTANSSAVDINNNGQVVVQLAANAYICSGGTITKALTNAYAYGMNNNGQVVGESGGTALLYDGVNMVPLGTDTRRANGINDSNVIVGNGNFVVDDGLGTRTDRGFIYNDRAISVLPTLLANVSGKSEANSINNTGKVVGKANYTNTTTYAPYLYTGGQMYMLGSTVGNADSINDNDQIVGATTSSTHAFLYDNGVMTDLYSTLFSNCHPREALDINNHGQVVGYGTASNGAHLGFIYDDSGMRSVNSVLDPSAKYSVTDVKAINDSGWILATGKYTLSSAYTRALLLKPASRTWDGGGTDNNWSTPANWSSDTLPINNSDLIFTGAFRPTNIRNGSLTSVGLITFNNGGFNITGNALILNSGIKNTAGNNSWGVNSTLAFPQSFTSCLDTLTISGNVNNNGQLLTIDGSGNHLITGEISGAGGLTKSGTGDVTLSGENIYTGDTIINDGVLELDATGQLDAASTITNDTAGTFRVDGGSHTVGAIMGIGTTDVISGVLITPHLRQETVNVASGAKIIIAPVFGSSWSGSTLIKSVPEPSVLFLILTGAMCLIWQRMRK